MQPTLGLIVEKAATEAAPAGPRVEISFGPEPARGYALPSLRGLIFSVVLHAVVVTALMSIRFPVAMPPRQPAAEDALNPTEIRIGKHVYYVAQISGTEKARELQVNK